MPLSGDVVELVDTLGLEPSAARRGGSTPSIPTNRRNDDVNDRLTLLNQHITLY